MLRAVHGWGDGGANRVWENMVMERVFSVGVAVGEALLQRHAEKDDSGSGDGGDPAAIEVSKGREREEIGGYKRWGHPVWLLCSTFLSAIRGNEQGILL